MKTLTEKQWNSIKPSMKGRVSHAFDRNGLAQRLIGRRTLIIGGRMLIEGIQFVIDESLI